MEVWKDVIGYEGIYMVSNYGRIHNVKFNRPMKASPNKSGYLRMNLSKENKMTSFYVHRLVAEAFIPNQEGKSDVNHIDGNKENNHIDNLEWSTRKENMNHAQKNGLLNSPKGEDSSRAKLSENEVVLIKELVAGGASQSQVARQFGMTQPAISYIIRGINWKHTIS